MPSAQRRSSARPGGKRSEATQRPPAHLAADTARITEIVEPVATSAGYDLEDLSVVRMGRRFVVRVTIDRDGGVPLDEIANLARAVSNALDDAEAAGGEVVAGEYQLEVSSPGVDRPLTAPRHWRRNVGRLVKVKVSGAGVIGRVTAADDAGVTIDVDGNEREVGYADLGAGRVEIEFSRIDDIPEEDMVDFDDTDSDGDSDEDNTGDDTDAKEDER